MCNRDRPPRECDERALGHILFADLDEPQPALERAREACKEYVASDGVRVADAIKRRQCKRAQDRRVGGKQGRNADFSRALPGELLILPAVQLAGPSGHAPETQTHPCVLVVVVARKPGITPSDIDAELLVKLARERRVNSLARLDLASRKFPVAGVDLARGSLSEQERAVVALQDSGSNLDA